MKFSSSSGSTIQSMTRDTMLATTGTSGQTVFCSTYNTIFEWKVDRWLPQGIPDPRYGVYWIEYFDSNVTTYTKNWTVAATVQATAATATNLGFTTIRQSSASARASLALMTNGILLGSLDMYIEAMISIPTLATAGEDFSCFFGLNDAGNYVSGSLGTDAVGISLNRGVNGDNLITHTISNTTATSTNTSTAVTAATAFRPAILIKGSSSVDYYVNGTSIATAHTTNIPTASGRQTAHQVRLDKIAGTGNSDLQISYYLCWAFFNSSRVS